MELSRGRYAAIALLLFASTGLLAARTAHAQAADVFISEYIEGASFDKAVEIYNGTDSAVDLGAGGYRLELYSNGSTAIGASVALTATIAPGDVYVLCHTSASQAIKDQCDLQNGAVINFNGDDAVVLRKGGVSGAVVDALGQVGFDPGSEWGTGNQSTADNTIRRKAEVCAGDTNPGDAFVPSAEWDGFAIGTVDGLGSHAANCGGSGLPLLGIADISVDEAAGNAVFTLQLNQPAGAEGASVAWSTADGSAQAGSDYVAASGTASFAAGADTATVAIALIDDAVTEANETFFVNFADGAGLTVADPQAQATIVNDDVTLSAIHDIQGPGATSPLDGALVYTTGIVTGRKGNGFFLQAPDSEADADPATSEGVFVFTGSAPPAAAAVGNLVRVSGVVDEYVPAADPYQLPLTEISGSPTVTLLSSGNALPVPVHAAFAIFAI